MNKLTINTESLNATVTDIQKIGEHCLSFLINIPLNFYTTSLLNSITHLVGKKRDNTMASYLFFKGETLSIMITNHPSFNVTQSHLQKNIFATLCQINVRIDDKKLREFLSNQSFVIEVPTLRLCSLLKEYDISDGEIIEDMFDAFYKTLYLRVTDPKDLFYNFTLTKTNGVIIATEYAENNCQQEEYLKALKEHHIDLPGRPNVLSLEILQVINNDLVKIPSIEFALLTTDGRIYIQTKIMTCKVHLAEMFDTESVLQSPIESPFPFNMPLLAALLKLKSAGHKHINYRYDTDTLQIQSAPVSYKIRLGLNIEALENACQRDLLSYKTLTTGHLTKRSSCPKTAVNSVDMAHTNDNTMFLMQLDNDQMSFIYVDEGSKREIYNTLECSCKNIDMWRIKFADVKTLINTINEAQFEIFEQNFKDRKHYYIKTVDQYSNKTHVFRLSKA